MMMLLVTLLKSVFYKSTNNYLIKGQFGVAKKNVQYQGVANPEE